MSARCGAEACRAREAADGEWLAGAPHPDLAKGMQDEHCEMAGCEEEFVTPNYGVVTTPRKEYEIAVGNRACPEKDMLDKKGKRVREIKKIAELMKLPLVETAKLVEQEVVSVVSCDANSRRMFCACTTRRVWRPMKIAY